MAKSVTTKTNVYKKFKDPKTGKKVSRKIGTKVKTTNTQKGANSGLTTDEAKLRSQEIQAGKEVKLAKQANIANVVLQAGQSAKSLIGSNPIRGDQGVNQMVNGGAIQGSNSRTEDENYDDPFIVG